MAVSFTAKAAFAGGHLVTWSAIPNGQQGIGWSIGPFWATLTAQLTGTLGAGGSVTMEGSMDNTNWGSLHQAGGTVATLTALGLVSIVELPLYIRPNVTAGDGTTALTVQLLAVGGRV
jgi:hypothetical protein